MQKLEIRADETPVKINLKKIYNKRAEEAEQLEAALKDEATDSEMLDSIKKSLASIEEEAAKIKETLAALDEPAENQLDSGKRFDVAAATGMRTLETHEEKEVRSMNNEKETNEELRSFQKYVSGGLKTMTDTEIRSLNKSGAAAVLPVSIHNEMITSEKYSDLLHRAKVFNEQRMGVLNIPIASATAADWHGEGAEGNDKSPALDKIQLGGYELLRLMTMSAATASMTEAGFTEAMLQLLSTEVVETLEAAFINGTGEGQPKGLTALEWDEKNTVTAAEITFKEIAAGLGKLPQKYARGAIILCNADTAYNTIMAATDNNGAPIFQMAGGTNTVLGHEIVVSEHMPADTVYIVDPKELYVRFAMPVTVESDRSSGFRDAVIDLRALAVVDAAWNKAACVKVAKAA